MAKEIEILVAMYTWMLERADSLSVGQSSKQFLHDINSPIKTGNLSPNLGSAVRRGGPHREIVLAELSSAKSLLFHWFRRILIV